MTLTDARIREQFRALQANTGWDDTTVIDTVAENNLPDDAADEQREAMRARVRSVVIALDILNGAG